MTIEEKLKDYIINEYGSVRKFTLDYHISYSTVATLFTRGIATSSATTLIKICQALCISADELLAGRIVKTEDAPKPVSLEDMFYNFKQQLQNTENLTLNGKPVDPDVLVKLSNSLEVIIEIESRNNKD